MNPDALIASLKQEIEQCGNDEDRRREILAEIEAADGLERPTITTETGLLEVADKDRAYLEGLRQELKEVEAERRGEVIAEIKRIEALVSLAETAPAQGAEEDDTVDEPSAEEIEQRKQVRGGRKGNVERARNAPVPDKPAPAETAPAQGAEEE